jgi:protein TonB
MLLSAILAVGIHACLLWADFGWIGKKPYFKPKPQRVTLILVSRPMPQAKPVSKLSKPVLPAAPVPATEPTPKPKPEVNPEPKPKPKSASKPIPKPETKSQPEPVPVHTPEIKTTPHPPEETKPSLLMPASEPVPYSQTELITRKEKSDVPATLPEPETRPQKVPKPVEQDQPASVGPVEAPQASAVIREAEPRYRDNPLPRYPMLARKRGYQGTVILDVFIDKDGRVMDMKVFKTSGYAVLDKAARATVEKWLFEPGMKGAEKIEMWVKIPIRFQLK